jgi:hypothetical protein
MAKPSVNANTVLAFGGVALAAYVAGKIFGPPSTGDPDTGPLVDPNAPVPPLPTPTMSREVAATIADGIYGALYGGGGWGTGDVFEDEAAVVALLSAARNDGDVALIIDAYGVRGWLWSGYMNLPAAIEEYLSESDRAQINDVYARAGITFRF